MDLKVYLHRTKKQKFAICEEFSIDFDLDDLPEGKSTDLEYINKQFHDKLVKKSLMTNSVKKFGTGYVSFARPQYEGEDDKNGNDIIYFDNKDMIFKRRGEAEQ